MFDFSATKARDSIETSLKKLGVDYIDVIQVSSNWPKNKNNISWCVYGSSINNNVPKNVEVSQDTL